MIACQKLLLSLGDIHCFVLGTHWLSKCHILQMERRRAVKAQMCDFVKLIDLTSLIRNSHSCAWTHRSRGVEMPNREVEI